MSDKSPIIDGKISFDPEVLSHAFWFGVVALLWGGTNPYLKKACKGIDKVEHKNLFHQFYADLKFMVFNWKYLLAFLINQSGSLVFYLTLATAELSLAVPITNSLTFVFTALSGKLCGEKFGGLRAYLGIALIFIGVSICVLSKHEVTSEA